VGHLVVQRELLDRWRGSRDVEGTSGQVAPSCGAGSFHCYQYAPCAAQKLA
jgi:hypothetical protein